MTHDVFISFASEDKATAEAAYSVLPLSGCGSKQLIGNR